MSLRNLIALLQFLVFIIFIHSTAVLGIINGTYMATKFGENGGYKEGYNHNEISKQVVREFTTYDGWFDSTNIIKRHLEVFNKEGRSYQTPYRPIVDGQSQNNDASAYVRLSAFNAQYREQNHGCPDIVPAIDLKKLSAVEAEKYRKGAYLIRGFEPFSVIDAKKCSLSELADKVLRLGGSAAIINVTDTSSGAKEKELLDKILLDELGNGIAKPVNIPIVFVSVGAVTNLFTCLTETEVSSDKSICKFNTSLDVELRFGHKSASANGAGDKSSDFGYLMLLDSMYYPDHLPIVFSDDFLKIILPTLINLGLVFEPRAIREYENDACNTDAAAECQNCFNKLCLYDRVSQISGKQIIREGGRRMCLSGKLLEKKEKYGIEKYGEYVLQFNTLNCFQKSEVGVDTEMNACIEKALKGASIKKELMGMDDVSLKSCLSGTSIIETDLKRYRLFEKDGRLQPTMLIFNDKAIYNSADPTINDLPHMMEPLCVFFQTNQAKVSNKGQDVKKMEIICECSMVVGEAFSSCIKNGGSGISPFGKFLIVIIFFGCFGFCAYKGIQYYLTQRHAESPKQDKLNFDFPNNKSRNGAFDGTYGDNDLQPIDTNDYEPAAMSASNHQAIEMQPSKTTTTIRMA